MAGYKSLLDKLRSIKQPAVNFRNPTITGRLIISLMIVIVFVSTIAIFTSYFVGVGEARKEIETEADVRIASLTRFLEMPLWNFAHDEIGHVAQAHMEGALVTNLRIVDSYGAVLFSAEEEHETATVTRASKIFHEGQEIGYVEIALSQDYAAEMSQQFLWSAVLIILVNLACLVAAIVILMPRFLRRPMEQIAEIANRYGAGEYDISEKQETTTEFRPVISVLDRMSNQIQSQIDKLRRSEKKYRDFYDNAPAAYFSADSRGIIREGNKAAHLWLGYSPGELIGKNRLKVFAKESKAKAKLIFEDFKRGITIENEEVTFMRKDGQKVYGLLSINAIRDKDGRIIATRGVAKDITERKRLERALAAEKERLEVTLRSTGDGVISTDLEGKAIFLNRVAEELTGWTQEEAVGKPLGEVFHIIDERTRRRIGNPAEKVLKTGRIISLINRAVLISRDGTERIIADSSAPIRDEGGNLFGVVMVFRDITELWKLEKEAQEVEKLQSIGALAGGIAHDFNNILTGILGNITLAERYIEPEGKAAERLLEAKKASMRAKDLTQQLLTFSKGGAPIRKTVSIAELIQDSATFASRGSNTRCEFSLPDALWLVEADEGQMNQVITNLVINADEAMPGGGIISIRAENIVIKRKGALPLPSGKYVKITVEDNGVGIPKKYLGRIFEPYFTTKKKGSGLGLATTYSILKNHGGYITAESELGVGTTFYIYLPASKKPVPVKNVAAGEATVRGQGKILVMDDEEVIRELLHDELTDVGYDVELTVDGTEAIKRYTQAKESGQPFDAVILDLTVPGGMGGKEAIKKLLKIAPDIKAIVSSGYSTDPIMADFKKYGFSAVVTKPYSVEELERTLHSILGKGRKSKSR